ncbi:MAG: aldo/keto reductase [Thermodesulfobacteriota bacterium]|nr:aldo/keto reductase [Thermodesulfobacteriota bacterium]
MKYRRFGKLNWDVSVLGFGAMRLPVIGNDQADIDELEAINMIHYAIDHGVNYIDTAYPYHVGKSEIVVGRALQHGYREKVKLATKLPSWFIKKREDCDRYLNEQLEKLQTDHIDFYLLHGLNRTMWPKLRDLGVLKWAESTIADGRIHYLGFSFHDDFESFKEIIDDYDKWTFCQIQYNFMDVEYQAGVKGLHYAQEKGLAVVVMEPIRGGQLTKNPPKSVTKLWESALVQRTPADWALQWIWNQPEVSVVLSGMTVMQHVIENIESANRSGNNSLTDQELSLIDKVRDEYRELSPIPCTHCKYCMPCPNDIDIPLILEYYNEAIMYDETRTPRFRYRQLPKEKQADHCIECRECEERCPQNILISEWLKKAHDWLGPKK